MHFPVEHVWEPSDMEVSFRGMMILMFICHGQMLKN